jgi:hypothetical protein
VQVDEIRNLAAKKQLTYTKIAGKYGVSCTTVSEIVKYKNWKPEDDPRRKQAIGNDERIA